MAPEGVVALDGHHSEVGKCTPQLTPLREGRGYAGGLAIRVEYVVWHRLKVVDQGQVYLWVPEVGHGVYDNRAGVGTDEVVLLSVAVE